MNNQPTSGREENPDRIAQLVAGYIQQTLSPAEHDELDRWVEASDANMRLFEELTDENKLRTGLEQMRAIDTEARLQQLKEHPDFTRSRRPAGISRLWMVGVAAALVLAVAAVYLFWQQPEKQETYVAKQILPPANTSTLRLSDGRVVQLAAASEGQETVDGGSTIRFNSGGIAYTGKGTTGQYNLLSTGTGNIASLELPDGSRVWLNAASSLRFPLAFNATDRTVELQGEGYFEVQSNAERPFIVKMQQGRSVKVLGTHFNVRDYRDETIQRVSLLEGKVEVRYSGASQLLRPMQQAVFDNGLLQLYSFPEAATITGWKERLFVFRDAPLEDILTELRRWYGVNVIYNDTINERFTATISRDEPLSKLLQLLQLTGKVKFKTENKTIYVLQ